MKSTFEFLVFIGASLMLCGIIASTTISTVTFGSVLLGILVACTFVFGGLLCLLGVSVLIFGAFVTAITKWLDSYFESEKKEAKKAELGEPMHFS